VSDAIVALVTVAAVAEAEAMAEALVSDGLAACVNIVDGVRSIYCWKGQVCRDQEQLLIIKSRREIFTQLEARIHELHSYEVPEIIALPVELGSSAYLQWIAEQTARR